MDVPYFMNGKLQMEKVKEKKEQERINMPKGKFICGLKGCEAEISSAHQKEHAYEFHNMTLEEYKIARKQQKSKESAVKRMYEPPELSGALPTKYIPMSELMPRTVKNIIAANKDTSKEPIDLEKEVTYGAHDEIKAIIPEVKEIPEDNIFKPESIIPVKPILNDDRLTPKEIIEVKEYTCPHCGGKLKMKE